MLGWVGVAGLFVLLEKGNFLCFRCKTKEGRLGTETQTVFLVGLAEFNKLSSSTVFVVRAFSKEGGVEQSKVHSCAICDKFLLKEEHV